jgi:hypothetical protein
VSPHVRWWRRPRLAPPPSLTRGTRSLLYWTSRDGYFGVPYGTLIDEPTLKPMYHQFVGWKAVWYEILDKLPQHDERAPSANR